MSRFHFVFCATLLAGVVGAFPATSQAQLIVNPTAEQVALAMDIPADSIVPGSAQFVTSPDPLARAVASTWGVLTPQAGTTLAVLSTGTARTPAMPDYIAPATGGKDWGTGPFALPVPMPVDPSCLSGDPRDLTEFRVDLIAPPAAAGFRFDHNFFAIDYPEFVCTVYNDGFVAVVESPTVGVVNVAFDSRGNPTALNTAFFMAGESAPLGTAPLALTGYETGGATMWNAATVGATPGETVTLRFFVYEGADGNYDSQVLLDNFQWIMAPTEPPIANAGGDVMVMSALSGHASVTLNGTLSSDPEGEPLTYGWTGAFGTAAGATPTIVLTVGVHAITLSVSDPAGQTAIDTLVVTVLDGGAAALASIASHDASIAVHDASIAAHDASIAALQKAVAALQAQVAALQKSVARMQGHPTGPPNGHGNGSGNDGHGDNGNSDHGTNGRANNGAGNSGGGGGSHGTGAKGGNR